MLKCDACGFGHLTSEGLKLCNIEARLDRQVRTVQAFVERCIDIRDGSPNAFYAHVDEFCKQMKVSKE